jgi:hypothetical protein
MNWQGWLSVLFSGLLVIVVAAQVVIAEKTDETARETLHAQRPWVAAARPPAIIEPLSFSSTKASIRLGFYLKNGGTSPALGTTATPVLMITPFKIDDINGNRNMVLSTCTRNRPIREGIEGIAGLLILPRDAAPFPVAGYTLPRDYLPEADGTVSAWIIGCVDYRDQFRGLHGIGSIYTFVTKDGHHSFKPEGTVDGTLQEPIFEVIY